MSEKKIQVGYVFKFDCNNTVPRLKGALEPGENVSARVSREIKPHPESMTTWYDLEIPAVVHEAFSVRLTAPEVRDMGGELDFLASVPAIAADLIAANIRGDHEEVISIYTWVGKNDAPEQPALIAMHEHLGVADAIVESLIAWRAMGPSEEETMRGQNKILDVKRRLRSLGYGQWIDDATGMPYWAHLDTRARLPFTGDAFSASFVVDDLGTSVEEYDEKGRPVTRSLIE